MESELKGRTALSTGASMGIGEAIAIGLAEQGMNAALLARSRDKLEAVRAKIADKYPAVQARACALDIQNHGEIAETVKSVVRDLGEIEVLVNNAGLALGAPTQFCELPIELIYQMNGTNVAGVMYTIHSVLKGALYHANKACLEGFTNSLRSEIADSDIRVSTPRPGCVASHFHLQRVKYDKDAMDEFFYGYEPLVAEALAEAVEFLVSRPNESR
ncbi:hypothetical protein BJX99DRAFT_262975 [Aspergillus californicus]